jgi:NADH-quinone oxidoreductase subunit I
MADRYRGHIELIADPETGKPLCVACKLCERACPSDCIVVEGVKREGEKRRAVVEYRLDFTKCSLCAACVEACNTDAIRFSKDYNLAGTSKDAFVMDLLKRLETQHPQAAVPAGPGQPPAVAAPAAPGGDGRPAEGAPQAEETKAEAR